MYMNYYVHVAIHMIVHVHANDMKCTTHVQIVLNMYQLYKSTCTYVQGTLYVQEVHVTFVAVANTVM